MATEKRLMSIDDFKRNLCHYCNTYMSEEPCEPGECWVHDVIAQTDTVDAVEVVHGRWIEHKNEKTGIWHYDCSICDDGYAMKEKDYHTPNYCPNCGADMRERKDNED